MFTLFPQLPAELQLKIWDASLPRPGIHIFDVCFQDISSPDKSISGEVVDEDAHTEQTFLSSLNATAKDHGIASSTIFKNDPSAYKIANILSTTTIDSSNTVKTRTDSNQEGMTNVVRLPSQREEVSYDNDNDVLCLRFGFSRDIDQSVGPIFRNNISRVLEALWSEDMAASLFSARRLAIDIAEMWSPGGLDPMLMAYFCCCIQNDLEVLYLVDYCVGRCKSCFKGSLKSKDLVTSKCGLAKELDTEDREMDAIYGSTVAYREVSNLEKLGWDSGHSVFGLAQVMGDIIREQQGKEGPFRSVRILVCEEEVAGTIRARCVEGH
ncbi:2EXR domain-containing protein [Fusarium sp. LHS14.1]|nr:2EXR domain-containing protein [Fusarium sp. LHS14.1]